MERQKMIQKFQGIAVSDKMAKTIVVRVDRKIAHPKYKKAYITSRKYKVHDENKKYKVGDTVVFVGCKPISKDKKWRVL